MLQQRLQTSKDSQLNFKMKGIDLLQSWLGLFSTKDLDRFSLHTLSMIAKR